jgi:DNA-binding NarL/FixJ family response regulator
MVLHTRLSPEFEVVAMASNAEEAVQLAAEHLPDVAIVDVQMPGGGGLHAARGIREQSPQTAIVAFSNDESRQGVLDMLDAGALTYVRKQVSHEALVSRVHAALAAQPHLHN